MKFNPYQIAVFDAALTSTESLVVKSYAGSGKTTVGVELAHILEGTTLLCAYGYEAGKDMERRCEDLRPNMRDSFLEIRTTNSLGMRTWMKHTQNFKLEVDRSKVRKMLAAVADIQPLAAKHAGFLASLISHAKRAGFGVLASIENDVNWFKLVEHYNLGGEFQGDTELLADCVRVAMSVYKKSLDKCKNTIDYDDQILAPMYYEARFKRFDNVILDEAQDTSPLRLDMVLRLTKSDGRFIAIGDENQSVMGFTGATNDSLGEIVSMTSAKVMTLPISYRLPKSALPYLRELVPDMEVAETNRDGHWLVCWLEPAPDHPYQPSFWGFGPFSENDAILCRKTAPLVELAYKMIRLHIPCRVEGRDIGAGLMALASKWKISDLSVLEDKLFEYRVAEMDRLNAQFKEAEAESIGDKVDTLLVLIGAVFEEGGNTIGSLASLIQRIFGETEDGKLPEMCTLSTVHKAKGREWQRVFVLGLDEYMPAPQAKKAHELRQERNLKFVAMSRHKDTFVNVHMPEGKGKGKRNDRSKDDTATQGSRARAGGSPSPSGFAGGGYSKHASDSGKFKYGRRNSKGAW